MSPVKLESVLCYNVNWLGGCNGDWECGTILVQPQPPILYLGACPGSGYSLNYPHSRRVQNS